MIPACIVKSKNGVISYETGTIQVPIPSSPSDTVYTQDGSPSIGTYKFSSNVVTYSITLPSSLNNIPNLKNVRDAVRSAFNCWHMVSNISFVEIPNDSNADITISFSSTDPVFSDPSVMAYTFYPNTKPNGSFTSVYNTKYIWSLDGLYNFSNNLNQTLRHELGHGIGMVHTTDKNDIMYPFYHNSVIPSSEDINQLVTMYGASKYPHWMITAFFKLDSKLEQFHH